MDPATIHPLTLLIAYLLVIFSLDGLIGLVLYLVEERRHA
jgi:hypothetical protein